MDDYVFVWRDGPGNTAGLTPLMRAANGDVVTSPDGFRYDRNYAAWCRTVGRPLPAWTYFYPGGDGVVSAVTLLNAAPKAPYYVVDIEDENVSRRAVATLVGKLSGTAPVYLSTYGLPSQADERSIPYAGVGFAGIMPQVYYADQSTGVGQWQSAFTRVFPTFSPTDNPDWPNMVTAAPCGIWRYGTADLSQCVTSIAARRKALVPSPQPAGGTVLDATDEKKIVHIVNQQLQLHDASQDATLEAFIRAQFADIRSDLDDIKARLTPTVPGVSAGDGITS